MGLEKGRAVIGDRRWAVMEGRIRSGPARAVTAVGPETNILDVAITRLRLLDVLSGKQSYSVGEEEGGRRKEGGGRGGGGGGRRRREEEQQGSGPLRLLQRSALHWSKSKVGGAVNDSPAY